jgi:hypothetical protein
MAGAAIRRDDLILAPRAAQVIPRNGGKLIARNNVS